MPFLKSQKRGDNKIVPAAGLGNDSGVNDRRFL
jgi:hypothetical protein